MTTAIAISGDNFEINGKPTYAEIAGGNPRAHGLLMNARFIQGIFDDKNGRERYARFGHDVFDPEAHTDALIAALPQWYRYGLRAFTVGIQGGGPWYTTPNHLIENNPFGTDGRALDDAYAARLDRLIRGADEAGMAVIVSFFYGVQVAKLRDGKAVRNAVETASRFLRDGGYTNVLIEVANEYTISPFKAHPILHEPEGMAVLLELARRESGGMPVGASGGGGIREVRREVCEASDYVLVHGNGCTRQQYANMIALARSYAGTKPIVCNEDSPCISRLEIGLRTHTSWGYYNNMTKQEPPADWGITPGEDTFFAHRMARAIGIEVPGIPDEHQFYLQGLEPHMVYDGKCWPRLACLYPEKVDFVEFYRNDELIDTVYDEPFHLFFRSTYEQRAWEIRPDDEHWQAVVHLCDGSIVTKHAQAVQ
ncbi:MAG: hypothetical protein GF331_07065 [Chitinivibrionales bacterium]|nr:hypothetical protein [Chitinivibrionales bacterium]